MSKKIKERTKQLASKEKDLKKKLVGKTGGLKSKAEMVGKTALIGGLIAIIVYGAYKAFIQGDSKPKKRAQQSSASGVVAEKVTTFLLPYLGKILDEFVIKRLGKSKSEPKKEEEED